MEHKHIEHFGTSSGKLAALERELACYYAALGVLLEECYAPGAGRKALGLQDVGGYVRMAAELDVKSTEIGRVLPVWVRYGFEGVLSAGYGAGVMDAYAGGALEHLRDMLHLLRADDPYFELCLDAAKSDLEEEVAFGGLVDLELRVTARHDLDRGVAVDAAELALLANMSERSVRNAMLAGGDLKANAQGTVDNAEAARWLAGRRGFVPTHKRQFAQDRLDVPDALEAVEIPPFIRRRLTTLWTPKDADASSPSDSRFPVWAVEASRECGLSEQRILAATDLPLDIRPQDCERLARAMQVDRVWLTHQVMSALFPEQVDMLLNPQAWRPSDLAAPSNENVSSAVTITLTDKMLEHGYLDLPASAKALFPQDCFGTGQEGGAGASVNLVYGQHRAETDIRVKSSKTISPRKRFGAWLNTELGARPGDRIRIEKTGEREYTLSHVTA